MTLKGICLNTGRTHFKKGHIPWLKGTKGLVKPNSGSFKKGDNSGQNSPRYNNGLCYDKNKNRWLIWCKDNTYALFSRTVMESILKRHLTKYEVVHHIDGNTANDEIENLKLMTKKEHTSFHSYHIRKGVQYASCN